MINRRRCAVCGRILSVMLNDTSVSTMYCPDRPCFLYPPVSTSRADDPTMVTYLVTAVKCTGATPYKLAKALGMASGSGITRQLREQEKRWGRLR